MSKEFDTWFANWKAKATSIPPFFGQNFLLLIIELTENILQCRRSCQKRPNPCRNCGFQRTVLNQLKLMSCNCTLDCSCHPKRNTFIAVCLPKAISTLHDGEKNTTYRTNQPGPHSPKHFSDHKQNYRHPSPWRGKSPQPAELPREYRPYPPLPDQSNHSPKTPDPPQHAETNEPIASSNTNTPEHILLKTGINPLPTEQKLPPANPNSRKATTAGDQNSSNSDPTSTPSITPNKPKSEPSSFQDFFNQIQNE